MAADSLSTVFFDSVLPAALWLLGAGFLVASARLAAQFFQFRRLRASVVLTWPGKHSLSYGVSLGFGVFFGVLVFMKIVIHQRPLVEAFGEGMMFMYYAYAVPLRLKIGHGFYNDGIWSDTGYVPYARIGGLSWREGTGLTLVLIDRMRSRVRRLDVPAEYYGEVRRLLRDKIAAHDIQFTGKGVDLGADEREVV